MILQLQDNYEVLCVLKPEKQENVISDSQAGNAHTKYERSKANVRHIYYKNADDMAETLKMVDLQDDPEEPCCPRRKPA